MLDLLNIFKKQTPKLEDGGCMPDINQQLEDAGVFKSLAIAHYNSGMDDMALHRLNEQGGALGSIPEEDFELLKHGIDTFSFLLPPPVNKKHTLAELAKLIKETYSIDDPKTLSVYETMLKYGDVEITKKYAIGGKLPTPTIDAPAKLALMGIKYTNEFGDLPGMRDWMKKFLEVNNCGEYVGYVISAQRNELEVIGETGGVVLEIKDWAKIKKSMPLKVYTIHYENGGEIVTSDEAFAVGQLKKIHDYAEAVSAMLNEDTKLEAWLQGLVSKSEQMMSDVKHSLQADFPSRFASGGEIYSAGKYVKSELLHIGNYANKLIKALEDEIKLEPWMKSNIAVVSNYIGVVRHYLEFALDKVTFEIGGAVSDENVSSIKLETGGLPGGFTRDQEHINMIEVPAYNDLQKKEFATGGQITRYKKGEKFYDEMGNEYRYAHYLKDARGGGHYLNDMKNRGILVFGGEKKLSGIYHKLNPVLKNDGGDVDAPTDGANLRWRDENFADGGDVKKYKMQTIFGRSTTWDNLREKLAPLKDGHTHLLYNKTNKVGGKPSWVEVRIGSIMDNQINFWDEANSKMYTLSNFQFNSYNDPYLKLPSNFEDGGKVMSYEEASALPKGGAVAMNEQNMRASAAEMIARKHAMRPKAIYDWATKHGVDIVKHGYILSGSGTGNTLLKANSALLDDVLGNGYDSVKKLIEKVEKKKKENGGELKLEVSQLAEGGAVGKIYTINVPVDDENPHGGKKKVDVKLTGNKDGEKLWAESIDGKSVYLVDEDELENPNLLVGIGSEIVVPKFGYNTNVKMKLTEVVPLTDADIKSGLGRRSYHFVGSKGMSQWYPEAMLQKKIEAGEINFTKKLEDGGEIPATDKITEVYGKYPNNDTSNPYFFSSPSKGLDMLTNHKNIDVISTHGKYDLFYGWDDDKQSDGTLYFGKWNKGDFGFHYSGNIKYAEGGEIPATDIEVGAWVSGKHYESKPIDGELELPTDGNNLRWWDEATQQLPGEVEKVLGDGGKVGGAAKTARVLIISGKNPLSKQLQKLTGDSWSLQNFDELENGDPMLIKHKKTNELFVVFKLRYLST